MSEKQTINDLLMEVAKLRKDNDYLKGELGYWKQQAQRDDSVSGECDTYTFKMRDGEDDVVITKEADSREKLEANVSAWIANEMGALAKYGIEDVALRLAVFEWLDRQAAITERECADEYVNTWTEGSVAWILQQYEDEKLMRDVDCEAKIALETEELQDKVDALEDELKKLRRKYFTDLAIFDKTAAKLKAENAENAELKAKVGELEAELNRTCTLAYDGKWLTCSNCGESLQWFGVRTVYKAGTQERALGVEGVRFCPFCGARIEGGESE